MLSSMTPSSLWNTLCSTIIKVREIVASSLTQGLCDHIRSLFPRRQSYQHVILCLFFAVTSSTLICGATQKYKIVL